MTKIIATPSRIFYRKGNFAIMGYSCFDAANIPTKLVGKKQKHGWFITIMETDLPNQKASFEGTWEEKPKGLSFKASSYEVVKPDSLSGIATFLVNNFDGIGRIVARRVVKRFGTDSYRAIEEKDEGLYSINVLTAEKIDHLSYQYRELESKTILSRFLTPYEISKGTIYTLPTMENGELLILTESNGILPVTLSKDLHTKDIIDFMQKNDFIGIKGKTDGMTDWDDRIVPKLIAEKMSFLKKKDTKAEN